MKYDFTNFRLFGSRRAASNVARKNSDFKLDDLNRYIAMPVVSVTGRIAWCVLAERP